MTGPTKSFVVIAAVTLSFAAISLALSGGGFKKPQPTKSGASGLPAGQNLVEDRAVQTFDRTEYGIRFDYPASWALETTTENGFDTINLFPPDTTTPVSIHIGTSYYGMGTVKTTKTTVHGYDAITAGDGLVGVARGTRMYTFDVGAHEAQLQAFQAILDSISLY
jgi:hypothetical protein